MKRPTRGRPGELRSECLLRLSAAVESTGRPLRSACFDELPQRESPVMPQAGLESCSCPEATYQMSWDSLVSFERH